MSVHLNFVPFRDRQSLAWFLSVVLVGRYKTQKHLIRIPIMNALVINLTRFGDLLQTQPVISALAAHGSETSVVCLKNFSTAVNLLRDVDNVFPLNGAKFLSAIESDWKEGLGSFENYCLDIEKKFHPDVVINLTPSIAARLLAMRLGRSSEMRGFALDEFGFNADTSGWAAFLQVASANRGASPFNVVDLFRKVAGIDEPSSYNLAEVDAAAKKDAYQLLQKESGKKGVRFVGFQPGASEERRRWPANYFKKLAEMLWEKEMAIPVLLGTESEAAIGDRIIEGENFPYVNLMGRTGLSELSAVLGCLDLLVTNDTGTMHLAAGLDVPVAAVFLATAQPFDTGPAKEGALALEPDIDCHPCSFGTQCDKGCACRKKVTPEILYYYASSFLNTGNWQSKDFYPDSLSNARAWVSELDASGFLDLHSISGHDRTDRAVWIKIQREAYRRFLDGEDFSSNFSLIIKPSVEFRSRLSADLESISALLFLMVNHIGILTTAPTESIKNKFLVNIQKMQDKMSGITELSVLGSLWMFQSQQQVGLDGLLVLLKRYADLVEFLKKTLE